MATEQIVKMNGYKYSPGFFFFFRFFLVWKKNLLDKCAVTQKIVYLNFILLKANRRNV